MECYSVCMFNIQYNARLWSHTHTHTHTLARAHFVLRSVILVPICIHYIIVFGVYVTASLELRSTCYRFKGDRNIGDLLQLPLYSVQSIQARIGRYMTDYLL